MQLLKNKNNNIKEEIGYIGGIIKRVNNFSYENVEGRQVFQKTVYLIQAFDINLGYRFYLEDCGVYSPRLTRVGSKLTKEIPNIPKSVFIDDEVEIEFKRFLQFIEPYKTNLGMLRVLSSFHYLKERNPELENEVIAYWLADNTEIELSDINRAEQHLREYDLI